MTFDAKGRVWVGTVANRTCVRVEGGAGDALAGPLRDYTQEMQRRGCQDFEIDLRACTHLDEGFLNVIADLSLRLFVAGSPRLVVRGASPHALSLFKTLSVDNLFDFDGPLGALHDTQAFLHPLKATRGRDWVWAANEQEVQAALADAGPDQPLQYRDLLEAVNDELRRQPPIEPIEVRAQRQQR